MAIPLDSHFIPAFSIEDVLLDKDTGAPLSGGLVYFEQDNQRGVLKPIYQITGTSPNYSFIQLSNPMTLSSIGTFEDSLGNPIIPYFYPYDAAGNVELYYVRVTSSEDVPQFDREAQPYISAQNEQQILSLITNEISNPQFINVLFDTASATYTYNVTSATDLEIPIAPDWDLVVSGTVGSVTVAQNTPVGSLNILTNPGTLLTLSSTGLTKLHLRQRIYGSPNLWGSGYLSGSFVAKTYSGTEVDMDMYYSQSNGTVIDQLIVSGALSDTGEYGQFSGSVLIPASDSSQDYPNAYIDIYFDVPLSIQVDITSIMVAFTGDTSIADIDYDQESEAKQIDHLFHYYKPQLDYKAIPSYLVGWDFRLNPCQELGTSVSALALGANKSRYIADQTIAFESASNVTSYAFSSASGLTITTASASSPAIIQYLPANIARELLSQRMSLQLKGSVSGTTLSGTVSIYWTTDASLPVLTAGTNNSLVSAVAAGVPTVGGGGAFRTWTQLTQVGRGVSGYNSPFTLTTTSTAIDFNSFESVAQAGATTATFMAIVIAFDSLSAQTLTLDYVSLVGGDIASRPGAQSSDEVLRQCEFYYEKSYETDTAALTPPSTHPATGIGALSFEQEGAHVGGANNVLYTRMFDIRYKTTKRTRPIIGINAVDGTASNVTMLLYNNGVVIASGNLATSNWSTTVTANTTSTKGISYRPVNITPQLTTAGVDLRPEGMIQLQFIADARLGLI